MALEISIKENTVEELWVLKPIGEIDIYTSPKLKEVMMKAIDDKELDILIDAENLEYLDSTGLGVLIGALKKIREKDKNIIITNIKPNIQKLFDITGLNKVFILRSE